MSKHFNAASLLSVFPEAMAKDKKQFALAQTTAEEIETLFNDNNFITLYARIDDLDEPLLDILAYDFKVDWYDNAYSIETKRQLFKDNITIHRKFGTVSSIQQLLKSIFGGGMIYEWYEYGGEPYCFKIDINGNKISPTLSDFKYFSEMIRKIKNVRSKLEGLNVKLNTTQSDIYAGAKVVGIKRTLPKVEAAEIPRESEILSGVTIGAKVAGIKRTLPKVDAMQYNTYEDIKQYSNDEIKNKTYLELLYKQED